MVKNQIKKVIKRIKVCINQKRALVQYNGNYMKWEEADRLCKGYDAVEIFNKVKSSVLEVINGNACYERDGLLFYEEEYNYPLLFHLQKIVLINNLKHLRVIDWGGALGSTYLQNRKWLNSRKFTIDWTVVEQPHFVEWGKENIFLENLKFIHIKEANFAEEDVVILSGVLQYIDKYEDIIRRILDQNPREIILERTPVGKRERIVVETVREPIYNASYACRLLSEQKLMQLMSKGNYCLETKWNSLVDSDIYFGKEIYKFKSFVFVR